MTAAWKEGGRSMMRRRCFLPSSWLTLAMMLLALSNPTITAFPAYDDPLTASPALVRPGKLLCTVDLITEAACDGYNKIITQAYSPPTGNSCPGYVSKVVLDVHGSVKGVQFDRYGTLFLGAVEILRTTTPEPSPEGIHWHIEKDVSDYLTHFLAPVPMNSTLSIPNTVDNTYTGTVYINATLSFYGQPLLSSSSAASAATPSLPSLRGGSSKPSIDAKDSKSVEGEMSKVILPDPHAVAPLIVPLSNPPASDEGLWRAMSVAGNQSKDITSFPWPQSNIARAYVDVYASPHQCEEFWYTNLPIDVACQTGGCGGGSYREILVYIDGQLAGAAYPFIVLYTGGINPFLWRPMTGIESFDIAAYRVDLTPFVGLLNEAAAEAEGQQHQATISIVIDGNNDQGLWYLSGNLLLYPDQHITHPQQVLRGGITVHEDTGPISHVFTHLPEEGTRRDGIANTSHHHHNRKFDGNELETSIVTSGNNSSRKSDDDTDKEAQTYKTVGHHTYVITGNLIYPNGSLVITTVSSQLSAVNENRLLDTDRQVTKGLMISKSHAQSVQYDHLERQKAGESAEPGQADVGGLLLSMVKREDHYPYTIDSYYGQDAETMELRAVIDISLRRTYESLHRPHHTQSAGAAVAAPAAAIGRKQDDALSASSVVLASPQLFKTEWIDQIKSAAIYNRSLDHGDTYKMSDLSFQTFKVSTSAQGPCYHHQLAANEGVVTQNQSDYACIFPPGLAFCGYALCNQLTYQIDEQDEQILDHPSMTVVAAANSPSGKGDKAIKGIKERTNADKSSASPASSSSSLWTYHEPELRLDVVEGKNAAGAASHNGNQSGTVLLVRTPLMGSRPGRRLMKQLVK